MVTKDVKQINELRFLSKTECYKVENEPLFLLGLVSLGASSETLWCMAQGSALAWLAIAMRRCLGHQNCSHHLVQKKDLHTLLD